MKILLRVGLINKMQLHEMIYFPEPHTYSKNKIEVELDLSNYAGKSDVRSTDFAKKTDLGNLI